MSDESAKQTQGSHLDDPGLTWPVGAVAERVGLPASTLRSWDRRYGIGPTLRTEGKHRRYSTADMRRVELMSRIIGDGVAAQAAAVSVGSLTDHEVTGRLDAPPDRSSRSGPVVEDGPPTREAPVLDTETSADTVAAIVAAAERLDSLHLASVYRRTLARADVSSAWVEVFAPALTEIGVQWRRGRLGVASEHLASELLQTELRSVVRSNRLRLGGAPVMLAGADDDHHHLPLLAVEAELSLTGVPCIFLGPRMPAGATIQALVRARPSALFLWASLPRRVDEPFWAALAAIDWPLSVVIGGPGWPDGVRPGGEQVTLTRVGDFTSAIEALRRSDAA